MMAQRYPTQYDGIVASAPAINWDKFIPSEYWPQLTMSLLGTISGPQPTSAPLFSSRIAS